VEVALTVDLARGRLWDLVTDVTRVGDWSPECTGADWLGTAVARPGARFEGHNRYADGQVSSVVCVVIEAVRPATFAWSVLDQSGDPKYPASLWRYDLLPGDRTGSTLVRHSFVHGPGRSGARVAAYRDPSSLDARLDRLRRHMLITLTAMTGQDAVIGAGQDEFAGKFAGKGEER
jgi:uncharacterized protein YndB with AHSA1/START domain